MTLYQKLLLFIGLGVNVQTLSTNLTLDAGSEHFQVLTPSGANRNVTLDAPGTTAGVPSLQGLWYLIRCDAAASYNAVIKNGGTTLVTLAPGDWAYVACGGSLGSATWKVMASSAGLATLTLTGALSAASGAFTGALTAASAAFTGALTSQTAAFSGRATTTDGVVSGNDRIIGGNVHTKQSATALTNSTTETTLGTHTLPANTLKAGTTVRVRATVRATAETGTTTLTLRLRLGSGLTGTVVAATAAFDLGSSDVMVLDALVTARAAPSASSALATAGTWIGKMAGSFTGYPTVSAAANYATNGALDVVVSGQFSAADANAISCEQFIVDVVA